MSTVIRGVAETMLMVGTVLIAWVVLGIFVVIALRSLLRLLAEWRGPRCP